MPRLPEPPATSTRPHFVFIMTDTQATNVLGCSAIPGGRRPLVEFIPFESPSVRDRSAQIHRIAGVDGSLNAQRQLGDAARFA